MFFSEAYWPLVPLAMCLYLCLHDPPQVPMTNVFYPEWPVGYSTLYHALITLAPGCIFGLSDPCDRRARLSFPEQPAAALCCSIL